MAKNEHRSGEHKTFRALFSIDAKMWEQFGKLAGGTNRAAILRAFVAWYIRQPGAKMPRRPTENQTPGPVEPPHPSGS
jgi:hypothetical protein